MPVAIICAPVSVAMSMIRSGVPSGSLGGAAEACATPSASTSLVRVRVRDKG